MARDYDDVHTTPPEAGPPDERGAAGTASDGMEPADSSAAQDESEATSAVAPEPANPAWPETLAHGAKKLAHIEGLVDEVALLRAAIHQLADSRVNAAERVKVLAELRHQIEALCTALKTQQALASSGDARAAELAQALDDLGDRLGVPQLGAAQTGTAQPGTVQPEVPR